MMRLITLLASSSGCDARTSAKDGIDAFKGELGDDERARGEKELEVITKKYVDAIDEALKHKEAELLKV